MSHVCCASRRSRLRLPAALAAGIGIALTGYLFGRSCERGLLSEDPFRFSVFSRLNDHPRGDPLSLGPRAE
jgi:hypothetical protein